MQGKTGRGKREKVSSGGEGRTRRIVHPKSPLSCVSALLWVRMSRAQIYEIPTAVRYQNGYMLYIHPSTQGGWCVVDVVLGKCQVSRCVTGQPLCGGDDGHVRPCDTAQENGGKPQD